MTVAYETPVDPLTLAIEQVAQLVSHNDDWQASVAKYSAEEAREFIVKSFYRVPNQQVERPFAIIFELPGVRYERWADGVTMPRGELFLHLGRPMDSGNPELEERRFNNWHGSIARTLSRYAGAGYRLLTVITDPPARTTPANEAAQVPFWDVGYTVEWSVR